MGKRSDGMVEGRANLLRTFPEHRVGQAPLLPVGRLALVRSDAGLLGASASTPAPSPLPFAPILQYSITQILPATPALPSGNLATRRATCPGRRAHRLPGWLISWPRPRSWSAVRSACRAAGRATTFGPGRERGLPRLDMTLPQAPSAWPPSGRGAPG